MGIGSEIYNLQHMKHRLAVVRLCSILISIKAKCLNSVRFSTFYFWLFCIWLFFRTWLSTSCTNSTQKEGN